MLASLSAEEIVRILQYVSLTDINQVIRTSKYLNQILKDAEFLFRPALIHACEEVIDKMRRLNKNPNKPKWKLKGIENQKIEKLLDTRIDKIVTILAERYFCVSPAVLSFSIERCIHSFERYKETIEYSVDYFDAAINTSKHVIKKAYCHTKSSTSAEKNIKESILLTNLEALVRCIEWVLKASDAAYYNMDWPGTLPWRWERLAIPLSRVVRLLLNPLITIPSEAARLFAERVELARKKSYVMRLITISRGRLSKESFDGSGDRLPGLCPPSYLYKDCEDILNEIEFDDDHIHRYEPRGDFTSEDCPDVALKCIADLLHVGGVAGDASP
jgi:hypothetical protein